MVDAATLTLRPVAPGDADGLVALYGTLSDQDLYRRFFTAVVPPREFFEHMASVVVRGGFGVVAVDPGGRIVGEANYEPLADGDGELGMAVAPDARGIGHTLLDALIDAAQAHGVPNIEADVLVTNERMLGLLRGRGYATLDSGDWVSRRLLVGTAGPTPVWPEGGPGRPDPGRPRVLVEVPGGFWPVTEAAEAAGLAVITCSGPRGCASRCPVLSGRPCPLVAEADAVVVAGAPDDDPCWPALLRGHAGIHPDVPVCVEPRGGRRLDVATVERAARPRAARRVRAASRAARVLRL